MSSSVSRPKRLAGSGPSAPTLGVTTADNLRMAARDWSREEVEATVQDYLSMLGSWLAGTPFSKATHRRALQKLLNDRTEAAVEYKYQNVSAVLVESNFPYVPGFPPLRNYQRLLAEVVAARLPAAASLLSVAESDAQAPIVVPEVDDILSVLASPPKAPPESKVAREEKVPPVRLATNYVELEARNRSLGSAGEHFTLNFERARLEHAGKGSLAARVEHVAVTRGDYEGYDILSFEESGAERLVEVKTTKYGAETPFFVSRNELTVSSRCAGQYHLYRLFEFKVGPRLYVLPGSIDSTCSLSASTFLARPR